MKFLLLCGFLLLVAISCKTNSKTYIYGTYKTLESTKTEKWINYFTNKCIALGTSLELKKDSTYIISTCSYSANGYWKVKNDSLFLFENLRIKNIDSLVKTNKDNIAIDTFLIKKKYLTQNFKSGIEVCSIKLEKVVTSPK